MAQDQIIEEESPKTIGREDYQEGGFMYGYKMHEKSEEFLDYYFSLNTVSSFVDQIRKRTGRQHLLDLGSGVGRESDRFKRLLPRAYIASLDISDAGTRRGKQQFGLNQIQGDINMAPFGNEEFDAIHCKDVLVHIKDKEDFIKNVSRMLKKGGLFLVSSSDIAWEGFKQFNWDPDELKIIAEDAGLVYVKGEEVSMEKEDWYSYNSTKEIMLFRKK